ncbi:MAG: T9SS type A sorting domain-containing protein [Saprospiraceae bacterium]
MRTSILLLLFLTTILRSQNLSELPYFQMGDLIYQGAFRLPAGEFGSSSLNFSEGPIAYNPDNHSLFIVGHSQQQQLAEFALPEPGTTTILANLPVADRPIQSFTPLFDRPDLDNPDALDRIGGLWYSSDSRALMVTAYEYYDAPGDNAHLAFYWASADHLDDGPIVSLSPALPVPPAHLAGWISPVPANLQDLLGGPLLFGGSSGIPIISRTSVGPSAFIGDLNLTTGPLPNLVITQTLLDFSLEHRLAEDLENVSRTNDLWTHLSRAVYGLIVPGTRTYLTFGYSGGHHSGVCYKCTQDNGNLCGGYCAPDHTDYNAYYWLWDLQDLLDVKSGNRTPNDIRPYDYGAWDPPFVRDDQAIGGGTFDPVSQTLYLSVQRADTLQGQYDNPPVIIAYRFATTSARQWTPSMSDLQVYPNPASESIWLSGVPPSCTVIIYDIQGRSLATHRLNTNPGFLPIHNLAPGIYFLELRDNSSSWRCHQRFHKF